MKSAAAALAIALALALGVVFLAPMPRFESKPQPAASFAAALEKFSALREAESALPLRPEGASRLLHHSRKTPRAFVLLHGLTNCPEQFALLASQLHATGANVVIPRARLAGFSDRLNGEHGLQSSQDLLDQASAGLDIAAGLGDHTTLVGLSGSAVAALWTAQHRDGIDTLVLLAPFFGFAKGHPALVDAAATLLARLPNVYVWWDPVQKENLPGPPHAYPRFGTRSVAECLLLSRDVRTRLESHPPRAQKIIFTTTEGDPAANNALTASIADRLAALHGPEIIRHEFPKHSAVPHDMVDPAQPHAKTSTVYPVLLSLMDVSPAPPVEVFSGNTTPPAAH